MLYPKHKSMSKVNNLNIFVSKFISQKVKKLNQMFRKKQLQSISSKRNDFRIFTQKRNAQWQDQNNKRVKVELGNSNRDSGQKTNRHNKGRLTPNSFNKSQEIPESPISQASSMSLYDYKDIINNLLENGQNDEQWNEVPQIIKLIVKAMALGLGAVQNKITQKIQIINEQGLKIGQNMLMQQSLRKQVLEMDQKLTYITKMQQHHYHNHQNQQKLNQMQKTQQQHHYYNNREQQEDQQYQNKRMFSNHKQRKQDIIQDNVYSKGLDIIMIEQVKTITDAIISKKSNYIYDQLAKVQNKFEIHSNRQIQNLKHQIQESFRLQEFNLLSAQLSQKNKKTQILLNDKITLLQMQMHHFKKQLKDQNQAICNLGHFLQNKFCSKKQIQQLLKNTIQPKTLKDDRQLITTNQIVNRNKIEQIVRQQLQINGFLKKRQLQQFKQKIMKEITSFPSISQVQKIVEKSSRNKQEKSEQIKKMIFKHEIQIQKQKEVSLKKIKSQKITKQKDSRQKSPQIIRKVTIDQSKNPKKSKPQSHKVQKKTKYSKKVSSFQQNIYQNDISLDLSENGRIKKENNLTKSTNLVNQKQPEMIMKLQSKIKQQTSLLKQNMNKTVTSQLSILQKNLTTRLQTAQQQFCLVVEQNWQKMTQKFHTLSKTQKQNMERLLQIFSVLNIIARYTTTINTKKNQCLRWQKQVFNAINSAFYFSQKRTQLYITSPGIYHFHVVLYSLYQEEIEFAVELNSEEIYSTTQNKGLTKDDTTNNQIIKQNKLKSKLLRPKTSHPSKGCQYSQTLLIPAKSHLTIRLLQQMTGQGYLQIRKM